jgi:hypothetical protein
MPSSGSPTVRRRRLASELRRLRGNRKAGEIARDVGWSPSKISRAESGRESLPPEEIEKLVDYYSVAEPLRGRLLQLADDAVQRSWWDDYSDILTPQYLEFIGLEEEAAVCHHWDPLIIPGLLQTENYARQLNAAYHRVVPTIPPRVHDRFLQVRMRRQARLTREPVLQLSVVLEESVLLRKVGDHIVMRDQLRKLISAAELPNVDLRILRLSDNDGLVSGSFVIMKFGSQDSPDQGLSDVVSTEALVTEIYVEGEIDTQLYSIFFDYLQEAALSPAHSQQLIAATIEREWS